MADIQGRLVKFDLTSDVYTGHKISILFNQQFQKDDQINWVTSGVDVSVGDDGSFSLTLPETPESEGSPVSLLMITVKVIAPDQEILSTTMYAIKIKEDEAVIISELRPEGSSPSTNSLTIKVAPKPLDETLIVRGRLHNFTEPEFDYAVYKGKVRFQQSGNPIEQEFAIEKNGHFELLLPGQDSIDNQLITLQILDSNDRSVSEPKYQLDKLADGKFIDLNVDVTGGRLISGRIIREGATRSANNEVAYIDHRVQVIFRENKGDNTTPNWELVIIELTVAKNGSFTLRLPGDEFLGDIITLTVLPPTPNNRPLAVKTIVKQDLTDDYVIEISTNPVDRAKLTINAQLIRDEESSEPDRENECQYEDHKVIISYPYGDSATAFESQEVKVSEDGKFTILILESQKEQFQLEVIAPDNDILLRRDFYIKTVGSEHLLAEFGSEPKQGDDKNKILVAPKKVAIDSSRRNDPYLQKVLEKRSFKITGIVLDIAGKHTLVNKQVLIWGRLEGAECDEFQLILAARTDRQGYFSGDYPYDLRYEEKPFVEVYGVVGIGKGERVPVYLKDGRLPDRITLVVDVPEDMLTNEDDENNNCNCQTGVPRTPDHVDFANSVGTYSTDLESGTCVNFTTPNRTLEEFSFYTAVRTTDPQIISGTFDSNRTSDLDKLVKDPRAQMSAENWVDWDHSPTFYQATTIAHGHLLHFKQVWKADGYSMGDLLYSLPLAPCQKKQIAIVDWERRERSSRSESTRFTEALSSTLIRDRDISEIINSTLNEEVRGGSKGKTGSFGGGLGIGGFLGGVGKAIGGLLGISGGSANSSSSAWQNSSRRISTNALHQLRDATMQSASAVRDLRSTVVQTVQQGEAVQVQTEVVANHNHCHAITIEYFEVLRHFLVTQELVDVQECLFIPLLMDYFNDDKILRWREPLSQYLRNPEVGKGFEALEQIRINNSEHHLPAGRQSQEPIRNVEGELFITFNIARPKDVDEEAENFEDLLNDAWRFWGLGFLGLGNPKAIYNQYLKGQALKDRIFQDQIAPRIAEAVVDRLAVYAIRINKQGQELTPLRIPIDATLVSDYRPNPPDNTTNPLYISIRFKGNMPNINREEIEFIEIVTNTRTLFFDLLPRHSKMIVESGTLRYRTDFFEGYLFRNNSIDNDLTGSDKVRIAAYPLTPAELDNPLRNYKEAARKLRDHLNEHLEYYHQAIWLSMDRERRFLLLDGFKAPNAPNKSLASVVENRLIGISGNSLVMPVAPGFKLDPTYCQNDVDTPTDLLNLYAPTTPVDPMRISVPTRGVFAEAVMGSCNSCEKIDETRFWRFEESPCGDEPTPILPVSTDSRATTPPQTTPTQFPVPIINLQNAPAAPDPTGLAAALQLLGTPNLFNNITGLDQNQRNALAALQSSLETAKFFGSEAGRLAQQGALMKDIDKTMQTIESAREKKLIDDQTAKELTTSALKGLVGEDRQRTEKTLTTEEPMRNLIENASQSGQNVSVQRGSESVQVQRPGEIVISEDALVFIDLLTSNSAETRSFSPSTNSKSGITSLRAKLSNTSSGMTFRWRTNTPGSINFSSPNNLDTNAEGILPGLQVIHFEVLNQAGKVTRRASIRLSVPQFVVIKQNQSEFDQALTNLQLLDVKETFLQRVDEIMYHLLTTTNVRLIWSMAPFNQSVPSFINTPSLPTPNFVSITLRNTGPQPGLLGVTTGVSIGPGNPQEQIEIYPGAFAVVGADVTDRVADTVNFLRNLNMTDPQTKSRWIETFARMLAENIVHEILHSLLGFVVGPDGHNNPPIPFDILNRGIDRDFINRSGIEILNRSKFPQEGSFRDGGLSAMSAITSANQARIDSNFPVPPAFN